jgi:hypothetical protein
MSHERYMIYGWRFRGWVGECQAYEVCRPLWFWEC